MFKMHFCFCLFWLTFRVSYDSSLISQLVPWCLVSYLLIGSNSRDSKDRKIKLCYGCAYVKNSAPKESRMCMVIHLPLSLIQQDYIHLSPCLLFLQFSSLLSIFLLK